jgi:hypothetical protein
VLSVSLYFHTLRHLRAQQVLARLRYRLAPASVPRGEALAVASKDGPWVPGPCRPAVLLGPTRVRFLNRERELVFPQGWRDGGDRLWLYNLHYFDDLVATDAAQRAEWHEGLISAWIRDNPPAIGWEPYPVSLRVVNWIKWSLAGHALGAGAITQLATQIRFLRRRIEWHLLGNHIFTNAKALVFGGLFFAGAEADEWLEYGSFLLVPYFLSSSSLSKYCPTAGISSEARCITGSRSRTCSIW